MRELDDKTVEIDQSKQQRKNRIKHKIGKILGTLGTITKKLTLMSSESRKNKKKEEKGWGQKSAWINNSWNYPKLVKDINL